MKKVAVYTAGAWFGYQSVNYIWWRYKNSQTKAMGRKARENRDNRIYEFKEVTAEKEILMMDVSQLREGLLSDKFTSLDLVNVFGKRCYTVGR